MIAIPRKREIASQLKFILPAILTVILFSSAIFLFIIPTMEKNIMDEKQELLKDLVKNAWDILSYYHQQEQDGILTIDRAQKMAIDQITAMRYGPINKDYFWINNMSPVMLAHPYRKDLIGGDASLIRNPNGRYLFLEFVDLVKKHKEGFIQYYWQWHDDASTILPKISFVKSFKPWGWIIGSGIYLEDVEKKIQTTTHVLVLFSAIILIIITLLSIYIIWQGLQTDQERIQNERLFRAIFDQTFHIFALLQTDGITTEINKTALIFSKQIKSNLVGKPFWELPWWASEDPGKNDLQNKIQKASNGETIRFESRLIDKAGETHYIDYSIKPVRNQTGETILLVVEGRDITSRIQTEAVLKANEEKFRMVAEFNYDWETWVDPNGNYNYISPSCERITGYKTEEFIKNNDLFRSIVHPDDRNMFLDSIPESPTSDFSENLVYRLITKAGKTIWIHRVSQSVFGEGNRFMGIRASNRDITERRATEEILQNILETINQGFIKLDKNGNVIQTNSSMCRLVGKSEDQILNHSIFEFVDEENKKVILNESQNLEKETNDSFEVTIKRNDGTESVCYVDSSYIYDEKNEKTGSVALVTDITKLKLVEEELRIAKDTAEQANKAKSDFLATMSHEIRTPMNGVIGMVSLLSNTNLDEEQKNYLESIRVSGENLLIIINEILDLSKIEAGKLRLDLHSFNLNECIEEVLDLFTIQSAEKDLDLLYSISEDIPPSIYGDITRIRQILANLASNAVKSTEAGNIYISVEKLRELNDENIELKFIIKDSGMGIPKSKLDQLFIPFSQLDSLPNQNYAGTGLGLVICKRLVELMGGKIWVESEVGEGSAFQYTVIVKRAPFLPDSHQKTNIEILQSKKLLVLMTEKPLLKYITSWAEKWGLRVSAISSPELFEKQFYKDDPNLILLDAAIGKLAAIESFLGRVSRVKAGVIILNSITNLNKYNNFAGLNPLQVNKPVKKSTLYRVLIDALDKSGKGEKRITGDLIKSAEQETDLAKKFPLEILVAEDNVINQIITVSMLKELGYEADKVSNGKAVLQAMKNKHFDLIFMDIRMPGMDGVEATHEIIKKYPKEKRPVIVALTANAMPEDQEKYIQLGMDDYMCKPIMPENIKNMILKWKQPQETIHCKIQTDPDITENAILNAEVIESITNIEFSLFEKLTGIFNREVGFMFEKLKGAVEKENVDKIIDLVHKLKGMSINIGAQKMANLCIDIDTAAKNNEVNLISGLLEELDKTFFQTGKAFELLLNNETALN